MEVRSGEGLEPIEHLGIQGVDPQPLQIGDCLVPHEAHVLPGGGNGRCKVQKLSQDLIILILQSFLQFSNREPLGTLLGKDISPGDGTMPSKHITCHECKAPITCEGTAVR